MWRQAVIPTVLFGFMVLASCHEFLEEGENGMMEKLGAFGSIRKQRSSYDATWKQFEEAGNAEMKKKCDKNGGPQAFAKFQSANDEMKRCVKSVADINVDYERFGTALMMPGARNYITDVVKKGCRVYDKVDECASTAMEAYKACYNAEEQVAVKKGQNITSSIIHYVCEDNGAELLAFIDNQGIECVVLNMQGLAECIKKVMPETTNAYSPDKVDPQAIFKFMKFEDDECRKINTFQTCVRENLEKCNQQQPARFVDGLFNAFKSPTPCNGAPRAWSIPSASIILSALAFAYLSLSQKWF